LNPTFDFFYRQLGRATGGVLLATLAFLGLALSSALLGLPRAVISFNGAALSLAVVFVALLALFLFSSVVAAFIRWLDRRHQPLADRKA
jgi:hypothetical protein